MKRWLTNYLQPHFWQMLGSIPGITQPTVEQFETPGDRLIPGLVNIQKAIENGHIYSGFTQLLAMVIFHSYVHVYQRIIKTYQTIPNGNRPIPCVKNLVEVEHPPQISPCPLQRRKSWTLDRCNFASGRPIGLTSRLGNWHRLW